MIYHFGRDHRMRPIVIFNIKLWIDELKRGRNEDLMAISCFTL